jgi:hypothetical protein
MSGAMTCAFPCATSADCESHAPATACTQDCSDVRLEGYCVEPSFADGFTSGTCWGGGAPAGNILLRDGNNYTTTGVVSIPTVETASGIDLDVCWSGVTSDLQCHALDPALDVDNVALLRALHLSESQVEARLASQELAQSEIDGYVEYQPGQNTTCAKLSQLSFFGTPIALQQEYVESTDRTYMLLFTSGTRPGVGAHTMTFIRPTAASSNTRVDAPAGCGIVTFSADLSSLVRVSVPAAGPWILDWRALTRDGRGNAIAFERIDGVAIGYYEGRTVAELQQEILDLEPLATSVWNIALTGGRTADLSAARERGGGAAFPGFTTGAPGVWMLALTCSTCQGPAPVVLTVLEPVAGGG